MVWINYKGDGEIWEPCVPTEPCCIAVLCGVVQCGAVQYTYQPLSLQCCIAVQCGAVQYMYQPISQRPPWSRHLLVAVVG